MPTGPSPWLPKSELLSFEELEVLARCFVAAGVSRIRLTGGEPLLRVGLTHLVERLAALPGVEDLAMTTNAVILEGRSAELVEAGLQRMTVSLDSLCSDSLREITGGGDLRRILRGVTDAVDAGLALKINTVVLRETNADELAELLGWATALSPSRPVELRFIEYMDVGPCAFDPQRFVGKVEILERIEAVYGPADLLPARGSAPAERFRLANGTTFGVIAATTEPFCGACDRARLTAAGHLYMCLHGVEYVDLGGALRGGASEGELVASIRAAWSKRGDRGAEDVAARARRRLPVASPRRPAMHAIGG